MSPLVQRQEGLVGQQCSALRGIRWAFAVDKVFCLLRSENIHFQQCTFHAAHQPTAAASINFLRIRVSCAIMGYKYLDINPTLNFPCFPAFPNTDESKISKTRRAHRSRRGRAQKKTCRIRLGNAGIHGNINYGDLHRNLVKQANACRKRLDSDEAWSP